jgi:TetR/AcrR family transcriptional repressor of nem operon
MLSLVTIDTGTPGRPLSFDIDAAIDAALDLFWERGYKETSTRDLEQALGVSQSSIYNTFGSKQGLLLRAIDRYEEKVRADLLGELAPGGLESVDAFLATLSDWIINTRLRGCLVVSLMSASHGDAVIDGRSAEYRTAVRTALRQAMEGTAPGDVVDLRAESVLAASFGVHAIARTSNPAEVRSMVDGIRAQIADWASV